MLTLAAALALAGQEPEAFPEDPPATDLCALPGYDVAAVRANWTIIDARAMTRPADLAKALRAAPAGKRRVVQGGSFKGADMRPLAPLLAGACLAETELEGTNWEGTQISDLRLVHIAFTGAKVARARWPGFSSQGVDLQGSDFTGADLSRMRFVSGWQGTDFSGTILRAANLTEASFACGITIDVWCVNGGPDLAGADLTRADLSGISARADTIANARIDGTIIAPSSLGALAAARIEGPVRLGNYVASPYEYLIGGAPDSEPTIATLTPEEARLLIAAVADTSGQDRASFDCAKAAAPVEKAICGEYDSGLRAADRELAETWAAVRAAGKGDLAAQRRWLASRDKCGDDRTCLHDLYETRIAALRGVFGAGIALAPGAFVTYEDDALPLPDAMRTGTLYARILPVLREASNQRITLTGNPDGSIAAVGDAVGANAHTCNLEAEATRFDPATGWWSARGADGRPVALFRIEGRRIVLRYSGSFDTPDEASDFISCGARAHFGAGIDLTPR